MGISVAYDEKIAILDMGNDENRFSPDFLAEIDSYLDEIVDAGADGLMTTASGKFYTNGLVLTGWRRPHGRTVGGYPLRRAPGGPGLPCWE